MKEKNNMISYYELLGMIKDKTFPDEVVLNMCGKSVSYLAVYDFANGDFECFEITDRIYQDENFKLYLGECFLESDMFDKNLSIKPEPIEKIKDTDYIDFSKKFAVASSKKFTHNEKVIINKLNEIIDYINVRG